MLLTLTMAGRYQRFTNEGYKIPKYLLPWGDRTILAVILSELNRDKVFSDIFLVANHRDEAYMPHVRAVLRHHGVRVENLIMSEDTSGQAETAMLGIKAIEKARGDTTTPVVFHNIDTILLHRNLRQVRDVLETNSGFIDIFEASNKGYSYVLVDNAQKVTEIAEKIVVSDMATSGLYGFQTVDTFRKYYSSEDIYISSIFKKMVSNGESVAVGNKHKENDTIVLGTPEEYINASVTLL